MKLAVAACVAICVCLGWLSARRLARDLDVPASKPPPLRVTAARKAPSKVEKRALAAIDRRLHRKLRALAQR